MAINRYIPLLNAAKSAEAAAGILDQCAAAGELYDLFLALPHCYIIDGASRGYMAALITLSSRGGENLELDLRSGDIIQSRIGSPPERWGVDEDTYSAANRIMEDMLWSCADQEE